MGGAVRPLPVCVNGAHWDIFTFYSSVITVCAKDIRVRLVKYLYSQRSTSECNLIIQAVIKLSRFLLHNTAALRKTALSCNEIFLV